MCHVVLQFPVYELLKTIGPQTFQFRPFREIVNTYVPPQIIPLMTLVVQ